VDQFQQVMCLKERKFVFEVYHKLCPLRTTSGAGALNVSLGSVTFIILFFETAEHVSTCETFCRTLFPVKSALNIQIFLISIFK
jgi:hypothetical protein